MNQEEASAAIEDKIKSTKICGCDSEKFVPIFNMMLGLTLCAYSVFNILNIVWYGSAVILVYCFIAYRM